MNVVVVESEAPPRRRRFLGAFSAVVVVTVLVLADRHHLVEAVHRVGRARPGWVGVTVVAAASMVVGVGCLHAAGQWAAGTFPGFGHAVRLGAAAHALNQIIKSGGMAGLPVFLDDARRSGRSTGRTTAGYVLATVLADLAFAATLAVVLVVIAADGRITRTDVVAGALFAVLLAIRLSVVAAALRSRRSIRHLMVLPRRVMARVRRRPVGVLPTETADELYDAIVLLRRDVVRCGPAIAAALTVEGFGIATLAASVAAVGGAHAVAAGFVGYAIAVVFATVGFVPGGLGLVEVSLGATLVSFGSSAGTAGAAVAIYRVAEWWVPVAAGLLLNPRRRRS